MIASKKRPGRQCIVTGLALRKSVVWDRLSKDDDSQTLFRFGHEMGITVGHIQKGIIFVAVLLLYMPFPGYPLCIGCEKMGPIAGILKASMIGRRSRLMLVIFVILFFADRFLIRSVAIKSIRQVYGLKFSRVTSNSSQVAAQSFRF